MSTKASAFLADHWVSWLIELVVLAAIAFGTLSEVRRTAELAREETRRTAEMSREIMRKFDAALSSFAADKAGQIEKAVDMAVDKSKGFGAWREAVGFFDERPREEAATP